MLWMGLMIYYGTTGKTMGMLRVRMRKMNALTDYEDGDSYTGRW